MKISLVTTILNEEKTINIFLQSVAQQTRQPDEIIIVDGGSTDNTVSIVNSNHFLSSREKGKVKIIEKKGNRAVGRNAGIKQANSEIIAIADAGCILDPDWLEKITDPFAISTTDVVAGYYRGRGESIFQKCLIPYVLVMPDRVDKKNFLPATRSMAMKKTVWETLHGFDEQLSHNEDYAFAHTIKKYGLQIVFANDAIVTWLPPKTSKQAFRMFYRFALGDAEARLYRKKVLFIVVRYLLTLIILLLFFATRNLLLVLLLFLCFCLYVIWSVIKNYQYVKDWRAIGVLPYLQFLSDFAVISGTIVGIMKQWDIQNKQ